MKKILLMTFFLASCSASGPRFDGEYRVNNDSATVFVYKTDETLKARAADINVDTVSVGELKHNGYLKLTLNPGKHTITSKWPWDAMAPSAEVNHIFEAGKEYFFNLRISLSDVSISPTGTSISPVSISGSFSSAWEIQTKEVALVKIVDTKLSK